MRHSSRKLGPTILPLLMAALLLPTAKAAKAQTVPSRADALQLLAAAGMSNSGGRVLNPCGHATEPKVMFIDLNGDGKPEAVTQDHDPACYGPDPGYQSKLLVRDASGRWQVVVALLGVFKPLATRTKGWTDFTNESGSCHPVFRYNGRMYVGEGCGFTAAPWQAPHGADAAVPAPVAPTTDDNLRLFPETYGRFAPRGDCARLPRVTVSVEAIRLETAAGTASFTRPGLVTNFMGPQDNSITYQLQGDGEGLQISIEGRTLTSAGGDHLGAAERALDALASKSSLQRCSR